MHQYSPGQGGPGEVYRARDTRLDREVALKVLPAETSRDAERVARFEREARTLATLQHTLIATVHGIEETPEACAQTQQWMVSVNGGSDPAWLHYRDPRGRVSAARYRVPQTVRPGGRLCQDHRPSADARFPPTQSSVRVPSSAQDVVQLASGGSLESSKLTEAVPENEFPSVASMRS